MKPMPSIEPRLPLRNRFFFAIRSHSVCSGPGQIPGKKSNEGLKALIYRILIVQPARRPFLLPDAAA